MFSSILEYQHALLNFDAGVLQAWVARYCGDRSEASEVLQEVYVELLQVDLTQVQRIENFDRYLHGVCKNTAIKHVRKRLRTDRLLNKIESFPQAQASTPEVAIGLMQALGLLEEAIEALTIRRRRVFVMRRVLGYSTEEAALIRDRDASTISRTLCDAMSAILNTMSRRLDLSDAHAVLRLLGLEK